MSKEIMLDTAVLQIAQHMNSRYDGKASSFRKLTYFMDTNGWFGMEHRICDGQVMVSSLPDPFPQLNLWLAAFGQPEDIQYLSLAEHYGKDFPLTLEAFSAFADAEKGVSVRDRLICLDFICSCIHEDKASWTDIQIQEILSEAESVMPRRAFAALLSFCTSMSEGGMQYRISASSCRRPTNAFAMKSYARMAWIIFSDEAVKEGNYIQKAAADASMAQVWLFVAMHFIAAIRVPDLLELPAPELQSKGQQLRDEILNGTFGDEDAVELTARWLNLLWIDSRPPKKTACHSGITDLVVSIPTSVFPLFGRILALAGSYCEPDAPLISKEYATRSELVSFFGSEFAELSECGYFMSTRRFTKSYLQGVSDHADSDGTIHVSGYLVASILRSHKISYGEFSETTDDYLRDGSFTGITPEEVAMEMFERGIFGFIPHMFLSSMMPEWAILDIHEQTEVIHELALSPSQMEHVTGYLADMKLRVHSQLKAVLQDSNPLEQLKDLLHKVAEGEAPGKTDGCACLRAAAGLPCVDPVRSSCVGCGCEMWTRTGIHLLLSSYEWNAKVLKTASSQIEKERLRRINQCVILPTVIEILNSMSLQRCTNGIAELLENMVKRRVTHAADSEF